MAITCDEIKKLIWGDKELKKIIRLEKLSVWKTYKDELGNVVNIEDKINNLISKAKNSKQVNPDLIKYLKAVKWIHKNAFLLYQKSMATSGWTIQYILKKIYNKIIKRIRSRADLQRVVDNQQKFVDIVDNITNTIFKDINWELPKWSKKITKWEIKSYTNNIMLSGSYSIEKQKTLFSSFKKFIARRYKEATGEDINIIYIDKIDNLLNEIKTVNKDLLPFTEWDKWTLKYKGKITSEQFREFMKNKDKYLRQTVEDIVLQKIKTISNHSIFMKNFNEYRKTINEIFEWTKKASPETYKQFMGTLNKQADILSNVIKKWKIVSNMSVFNHLSRDKIEDTMKKLSFKITWYDISLPLNEQIKKIEDTIKNIIWTDKSFKVSVVDTKWENTIFKIEWDWYTDYIPVKDFNKISDSLNSVNWLSQEESAEKGVMSMEAERVIDSYNYVPRDWEDDELDLSLYIFNHARWKTNKQIEQAKNIINGNMPYFWSKVVNFIAWFMMNSQVLKEYAPTLHDILIRFTWINNKIYRWEWVEILWDIRYFVNKNIEQIEDNLWIIVLWKALKHNEQDISKVNELFKEYKWDTKTLYSKLSQAGLLKNSNNVNEAIIEDYINKFNNSIKIDKKWAYAQYMYKFNNKIWDKYNKIFNYIWNNLKNILNKNNEMIENYKNMIIKEYKNTYKDYFKDVDIDIFDNEVSSYLKQSNNIVLFNRDVWWNYVLLDKIFRNIPEYSKKWLLETELGKTSLSKAKKATMLKAFRWEWVFWKTWFPRLIKAARKLTYLVQLSWFSPKAYVLSWYNVVSWWVKALTSFSDNSKNIKEFIELAKQMKKEDFVLYNEIFWDLLEWHWHINENVIETATQHMIDDENNNVYEWLVRKVANTFNKQLSEGEIRKIASWLASPLAFSDKATADMFNVIPNMVIESMEEEWISIRAIKELWEQWRVWKDLERKILKAKQEWDLDLYYQLKAEYKKLWITDAVSARKDLRDYIKKIRNTATDKYINHFKVANSLWLSRNTLSDLWYINYFSAWGSKTVGEFAFQTVWKAYKDAIIMASKYPDGNRMWTFLKVFTNTLLTSPTFNSFIRQLWYGAKLAYILSKQDKDNNNINNFDTVLWTTLLEQWIQSNVITRWLNDMIKWIEASKEHWDNATRMAEVWLINWILSVSSNFFAEFRYSLWPILNWLETNLKAKWENEWWISNLIWDIASSFISTYKSKLITDLWYYLYDKTWGIIYERPDAWQWYNIWEAISWIQFTNYSHYIQKLKDYYYVSRKLEDMPSTIKNLPNSILWYYYWENNQEKVDKLMAALNKDTDYNDVRLNSNINSFSDNAIDKVYKKLVENDLLSWWGKKSNNSKLELVFNELKEKWVDINNVLELIDSWILKWNAKSKTKLSLLWLTKASYAVLTSMIAQQTYKENKAYYKKLYWWITDEQDIKLKRWVMEKFAPILSKYDNQFHTELLNIYLTDKYDENQLYQYYWTVSKNWAMKRSKVWDYVLLKWFTSMADAADIEWQPSLFQNISTALFEGIPDNQLASKMVEYFKTIDTFNFIGNQWKNVMKAGILYSNRNKIKDLLNSKYSKEFQPVADKLASIIWNFAEETKTKPNMLNGLAWSWRSHSSMKSLQQIAIKPYKSPATKIFTWIQDLAEQIVKLPQYKHIPVEYTIKKIQETLKKIPDIEVPNNSPVIEKLKEEIKTLQTKSLKTNALKTRKAKPKITRVKRPSVKAIKSSSSKSKK